MNEHCLYHAPGTRKTHTHVCGEPKGHTTPHLCYDCTRYFNAFRSWPYRTPNKPLIGASPLVQVATRGTSKVTDLESPTGGENVSLRKTSYAARIILYLRAHGNSAPMAKLPLPGKMKSNKRGSSQAEWRYVRCDAMRRSKFVTFNVKDKDRVVTLTEKGKKVPIAEPGRQVKRKAVRKVKKVKREASREGPEKPMTAEAPTEEVLAPAEIPKESSDGSETSSPTVSSRTNLFGQPLKDDVDAYVKCFHSEVAKGHFAIVQCGTSFEKVAISAGWIR